MGRLPSLLSLHFLTCQVGRQTQVPPWLSGQQKILLQNLAGDPSLSGWSQPLPSTQLTQVKVAVAAPTVRAKVSLDGTSSETHAGESALAVFASGAEHTAALVPAGRQFVCIHCLYPDLCWPQDQCLDLTFHLFPELITLASTNLNTDSPRQGDSHLMLKPRKVRPGEGRELGIPQPRDLPRAHQLWQG